MSDARARGRAALSGATLRRPAVTETVLPRVAGPDPRALGAAVAAFEATDAHGLAPLLTLAERVALVHDAERALTVAARRARSLREALTAQRSRETRLALAAYQSAVAHAALSAGRVR